MERIRHHSGKKEGFIMNLFGPTKDDGSFEFLLHVGDTQNNPYLVQLMFRYAAQLWPALKDSAAQDLDIPVHDTSTWAPRRHALFDMNMGDPSLLGGSDLPNITFRTDPDNLFTLVSIAPPSENYNSWGNLAFQIRTDWKRVVVDAINDVCIHPFLFLVW